MSTPTTQSTARGAPPEVVLIRYGELSLKGGNRRMFETTLMRNVRAAARSVSPVRIERNRGRLAVFPERRVEAVARRLQDVFGIASVSPAWGVEADQEAIVAAATPVLADTLSAFPTGEPVTFRVQSRRADKSFPLN